MARRSLARPLLVTLSSLNMLLLFLLLLLLRALRRGCRCLFCFCCCMSQGAGYQEREHSGELRRGQEHRDAHSPCRPNREVKKPPLHSPTVGIINKFCKRSWSEPFVWVKKGTFTSASLDATELLCAFSEHDFHLGPREQG